MSKPLLIAHRGDTSSFPENSLEAFIAAFEKGADGIEMDVQLKHNKLIVVHDYLFDQKAKPPLLEDVLKTVHDRGRIEIEIKSFNPDILPALREVLKKYPDADFELTTSEIPLSFYMKKAFPKIPLGLIFHDFFFQDWMTPQIVEDKLIGWGQMVEAQRLHISFKILNQFGKEKLVTKLHQSGFEIHSHIYSVEDQKKIFDSLSRWRVDQCTFDNIDLIKESVV